MFPESVDINNDKSDLFLRFIGEKEDMEHYSDVMLQTDAFVDYAKSSTHQDGVKKWFEKIILGEDESYFDELCQSINMKLLDLIMKTAVERQRKKTDKGKATHSLMIKVINLLQDPLLDGLIDQQTNNDERMAIIVLVNILNAELEKKQWNGLCDYFETNNRKDGADTQHNNRDVNVILGWAIFHLRWGFINDLENLVEKSEKEEMLQTNIEFLSSMRIYAEEAMLQQEYLDTYYDSFMRSANRGFLTLVTIKYFEFGSLLMVKVTEGLPQKM